MKFTEAIVNKVFGKAIKASVKTQADAQAAERTSKALSRIREGWENNREKEDSTWRRITADKERDLNPVKHDRMLAVVLYMYRMNPLAKRHIELLKDYTIGKGIQYVVKDERVKAVIDRFWNDPVNAWDLKQDQRIRELSLYGEQCYPVFVNRVNGHVRLGNLPPENIKKVIPSPDNAEKLLLIVRRGYSAGEDYDEENVEKGNKDRKPEKKKQGKEGKGTWKIINYDEDPESETFGLLIGEAFFFRLNSVSNSTRGISDLLPNIDWLDAYDRFLFTSLERGEFLRYLIFHLKMEGASPEQIIAKTAEFEHNQPSPGSTYVSDETESLTPVTPTLGNADTAAGAHLFKAQIIAGAGFGFHFFGEGENANRASAKEMSAPVVKMIEARQKYVKHMIGGMFDFQIDQAIIAKRLETDVDRTYEVILPEASPVEAAAIAKALNDTATGLGNAVESELISLDQAQEIFRHIVGLYGLEVKNPEKEKEKIDDEEREEEGKDYKGVEKKKAQEVSKRYKALDVAATETLKSMKESGAPKADLEKLERISADIKKRMALVSGGNGQK